MIDRIGGIGADQKQQVRQSVERTAVDMLNRDSGMEQWGGGTAALDAGQISEEAMEEIGDNGDDNPNIEEILKNILNQKEEEQQRPEDAVDAKEEAGTQAQQPQQAGQAQGSEGVNGGKKEVEEVKVSWTPLMKEGQVLMTGDPVGHFVIDRQKKEVDEIKGAGNEKQAAKSGDENPRNQGHPSGSPLRGAGSRGGEMKIGSLKVAQLPRGQDGKTPQVVQGPNGPEDPKNQQPKGNAPQGGDDGKLYIIDEGTGEKIEIPENGDIKATHSMKIVQMGKVGELGEGDTLFWYEFPKGNEEERTKKAKELGLDPVEGPKMLEQREQMQKERGQTPQGIDPMPKG
jgi:hypothetical protein